MSSYRCEGCGWAGEEPSGFLWWKKCPLCGGPVSDMGRAKYGSRETNHDSPCDWTTAIMLASIDEEEGEESLDECLLGESIQSQDASASKENSTAGTPYQDWVSSSHGGSSGSHDSGSSGSYEPNAIGSFDSGGGGSFDSGGGCDSGGGGGSCD